MNRTLLLNVSKLSLNVQGSKNTISLHQITKSTGKHVFVLLKSDKDAF